MKKIKFLTSLFAFMLVITGVICLTACGKNEFKPKELTTEQAKEIVNNAFEKSKNSTNVYMKISDEEFTFADSEGYYNQYYDYYNINNSEEKCLVKEWRVYNNSTWLVIEYVYRESGELYTSDVRESNSSATSYIEFVIGGIDYLVDIFDVEGIEVQKAIQSAENVIVINFEEDGDGLEVEIKDGYISKIKEVYSYDGETEVYEYNYSYNVDNIEVPQMPAN